jgi:hypothetical protein
MIRQGELTRWHGGALACGRARTNTALEISSLNRMNTPSTVVLNGKLIASGAPQSACRGRRLGDVTPRGRQSRKDGGRGFQTNRHPRGQPQFPPRAEFFLSVRKNEFFLCKSTVFNDFGFRKTGP